MYGIIIEWKDEGPLIMEGKPMPYDAALLRMKDACGSTRVIRAAIFKLAYETGNETLIKKEDENV